MAVKMKPKWFNAMFITIAQISQMIVGVAITIFAYYYYFTTEGSINCKIQKQNKIAATIMYGSYLFLFAQFFVGRCLKEKTGSAMKDIKKRRMKTE